MRSLGGTADRLQTFPNSIRQTTIDWAAAGGQYPATDNFVICGGDNMFHVNKGAIGVRVDAGDRVVIRNVEIDTVRNNGRPPSALCPARTTVKPHPMMTQAWCVTPPIGLFYCLCRRFHCRSYSDSAYP